MLEEPIELLRSKRWFRRLTDDQLAAYQPANWPVHNYGENALAHAREVRRRLKKRSLLEEME